MTDLREQIERAICAETCAFYGEPPCWKVAESEGEPCDFECGDVSCATLAKVAGDAVRFDALDKLDRIGPCVTALKAIAVAPDVEGVADHLRQIARAALKHIGESHE